MKKTCADCKIEKETIEFSKKTKNPDGLYNYCKLCKKIKDTQYYQNNKDKVIAKQTHYYQENRESILKERSESGKNISYANKWREANPEINKESNRKSRIKYKEKIKEYNKEYKASNRESINANKREYLKNPINRLAKSCRGRLSDTLKSKSFTKTKKFEQYLGCTAQEAIDYITAQFKDGMTWDNHGLWEIDHKIALATATTEEQVYVLCHYTNLQPLWMAENRSKNKY